jgi:hypothetical protein
MPIKRINEFPSGSGSLSGDDLFLVMDDPSGSGITKSVSLNDVVGVIDSGVAILSYDTISPAISGTVSDWNPGSVNDIIRASGISNARINGLVYSTDAVLLYNVGTSGNITLTHASGTANNQFLVPWLGDYVLSPNGGAALIVRDKVVNKWRIT